MILNVIIPTFNRYNLLLEILNEFSIEPIYGLLVSIHDSSNQKLPLDIEDYLTLDWIERFTYDSKLSGSQKYLHTFKVPRAKYNILLNDYDFFTSDTIKSLITHLRKISDFSIGKLIPFNKQIKFSSKRVKNKHRIFSELLYAGSHPTGWIFSSDYLKYNSSLISELIQYDGDFLYPHIQLILQSRNISGFVSFNYYETSSVKKKEYANLNSTKSKFLKKSSSIPFVDSKRIGNEIAYMIVSLSNVQKYSIISPIIFDYLYYGAIKVSLVKKKVFDQESIFHFHYNTLPINYTKQSLMKFTLLYIDYVESFLEDYSMKLGYLSKKLSLKLRIIICFPVLARIPSNLKLFFYRLEKKLLTSLWHYKSK